MGSGADGEAQQRLQHLKDEQDFRPAFGKQMLQRQLDRLCTASRTAGAHWHTGVCTGVSSQSAC